MVDNRNIVIKVKYPVSGKATENFEPRMVTEWNVKRILLAVGALVFSFSTLFYVLNKDTQKNDSDNPPLAVNTIEEIMPQVDIKSAEIKKPDIAKQIVHKNNSPIKPTKEPDKKYKPASDIHTKDDIKKQANEKITKYPLYSKHNHNISRAVLTYDINNKEPAGEIKRTISVSNKNPAWIYYFTELKSMKGSKVYHKWLKNGIIISSQELNISSDSWRTSSRKLLTDAEKGNWAVQLVDEHDRILNEKTFKAE